MKSLRNLIVLMVILSPFATKAQNCVADFTTVDSLGYTYFINSSSLGNSGIYFWDFGDGNYSTQQYPSNVYSSPGIYQVCLMAYDSNQVFCDSTCHQIVVNNVAAVKDESFSVSELLITPNPTIGNPSLSFTMMQSGIATLSVYDLTGREMMIPLNQQFSAGKQQVRIQTDQLSPGTYFLVLNVNGQIANSKLMITQAN